MCIQVGSEGSKQQSTPEHIEIAQRIESELASYRVGVAGEKALQTLLYMRDNPSVTQT